MKAFSARLLLIKLIFLINYSKTDEKVPEIFTFSNEFKFGAASAAYQIEGGWNEGGKSPSIWDTFTHEHPELIVDGSNGDVSADSYHFHEKDVEALKQSGVNKNEMCEIIISVDFSSIITDSQFHGRGC